jgi:isopentenyl-diphosphate Delta-isomerase
MIDPNQELIVYVDKQGIPTGKTAQKLDAHNDHTLLHAAFSCYIFDGSGRLLVVRRALIKKVWPGVWTNSVCGHLAPGESYEHAVMRRADFELGMKIEALKAVLPAYTYTSPPFNGIIENEFCPVYFAKAASKLIPNPNEVDAYKWLGWDEFMAEIRADKASQWSYWCKDQVKQFQNDILDTFKD